MAEPGRLMVDSRMVCRSQNSQLQNWVAVISVSIRSCRRQRIAANQPGKKYLPDNSDTRHPNLCADIPSRIAGHRNMGRAAFPILLRFDSRVGRWWCLRVALDWSAYKRWPERRWLWILNVEFSIEIYHGTKILTALLTSHCVSFSQTKMFAHCFVPFDATTETSIHQSPVFMANCWKSGLV